jgi:hypothetical protein
MIRDLVESLHLYSDPVGDLAKWSGKYMTGVTTLCMCKNKCNNGSSVKKTHGIEEKHGEENDS